MAKRCGRCKVEKFVVVSLKANRIKNNASLEELQRVATFYKELT